jgi:deazaflavin-dependent oxidoreductase (nitroreductase family)
MSETAPKAGTRGAEAWYLSPFGFKMQKAVHLPLYRLTGGVIGHRIGKITTLILTVTGAKSGLPRSTGLNYRRDGENFVVIASKGGVADHPTWFKNLLQNPEAEVQAGRQKVKVRARIATPTEKPRLWALMTEHYKGFDHYQESTDREIPVVVLEPIRG